ncbi:MAG: bifunctional oligoribonuclease/PAP phosphatase NrnA [Bacteroidales bacterium]|nr:bifunctional oligoribonuclease/PAP phosphatase NrnA [Bacteroidales bacterium]MCF8454598.1 bifunctional oligoribonuclease/PAP phosphatase NrnA [Bacteroidales bacterium]
MNIGEDTNKGDKYRQAGEWIEKASQIVVIPHHNPDGDAIGSALGVFNLLTKYGKQAHIISPNDFPEFLDWLPGRQEVIIASRNRALAQTLISNADLLIMTDFNCPTRIKGIKTWVLKSNAKKILIDHHPEPKDFADLVFSDTSVSSTAELLYEFFVGTGLESYVNHDVAACLYTGIMTDTGSFSYNSSNPRTFEVVGALLKQGINKDKIHSMVFNNFSACRMQLLGYCLHKKFVVLPEFNTGYISITLDELKLFDFQPGDTEGFVNYPLSVKGIIFSAIFIEKKDQVKVSFRSKGNFAANLFSEKHFSGGGHRNAAGGECDLDMEGCLKRFTELLPQYQKELEESEDL